MFPTHTVLLVEDNAIIQRMMKNLLTPLGCHVLLAPTAEAAETLSAAHPVDLIMMDYGLPDGDGLAVSEQIKQTKTHCNVETRLILITANYATEAMRDRCQTIGVARLYEKPFTLEQMRYELTQLPPTSIAPLYHRGQAIAFYGDAATAEQALVQWVDELMAQQPALDQLYEAKQWVSLRTRLLAMFRQGSECATLQLNGMVQTLQRLLHAPLVDQAALAIHYQAMKAIIQVLWQSLHP